MGWAVDVSNLGNAQSADGSTSTSFTTGAAVAADALVVVAVGCWGTQAVTSVTDNGPGLTWTLVSPQGNNASNRSAMAYARAPAGMASGTTITATFAGAVDDSGICGASWVGGDTGAALDATSVTATGSTANHSITVTTGTDGSLVIEVAKVDNGTSNTPDSNSTENVEMALGGFAAAMVLQSRIAGAAGSYTVGGTFGAAQWSAVGAAFKAADAVVWPPPDNPAAPPLRLARSNLRLG